MSDRFAHVVQRANSLLEIEGGNAGVFALAFAHLVQAENLAVVPDQSHPDKFAHVAAQWQGNFWDARGQVTEAEVRSAGGGGAVVLMPNNAATEEAIVAGTKPNVFVRQVERELHDLGKRIGVAWPVTSLPVASPDSERADEAASLHR